MWAGMGGGGGPQPPVVDLSDGEDGETETLASFQGPPAQGPWPMPMQMGYQFQGMPMYPFPGNVYATPAKGQGPPGQAAQMTPMTPMTPMGMQTPMAQQAPPGMPQTPMAQSAQPMTSMAQGMGQGMGGMAYGYPAYGYAPMPYMMQGMGMGGQMGQGMGQGLGQGMGQGPMGGGWGDAAVETVDDSETEDGEGSDKDKPANVSLVCVPSDEDDDAPPPKPIPEKPSRTKPKKRKAQTTEQQPVFAQFPAGPIPNFFPYQMGQMNPQQMGQMGQMGGYMVTPLKANRPPPPQTPLETKPPLDMVPKRKAKGAEGGGGTGKRQSSPAATTLTPTKYRRVLSSPEPDEDPGLDIIELSPADGSILIDSPARPSAMAPPKAKPTKAPSNARPNPMLPNIPTLDTVQNFLQSISGSNPYLLPQQPAKTPGPGRPPKAAPTPRKSKKPRDQDEEVYTPKNSKPVPPTPSRFSSRARDLINKRMQMTEAMENNADGWPRLELLEAAFGAESLGRLEAFNEWEAVGEAVKTLPARKHPFYCQAPKCGQIRSDPTAHVAAHHLGLVAFKTCPLPKCTFPVRIQAELALHVASKHPDSKHRLHNIKRYEALRRFFPRFCDGGSRRPRLRYVETALCQACGDGSRVAGQDKRRSHALQTHLCVPIWRCPFDTCAFRGDFEHEAPVQAHINKEHPTAGLRPVSQAHKFHEELQRALIHCFFLPAEDADEAEEQVEEDVSSSDEEEDSRKRRHQRGQRRGSGSEDESSDSDSDYDPIDDEERKREARRALLTSGPKWSQRPIPKHRSASDKAAPKKRPGTSAGPDEDMTEEDLMEQLRVKEQEANDRRARNNEIRRQSNNPVPSAEFLEEWEAETAQAKATNGLFHSNSAADKPKRRAVNLETSFDDDLEHGNQLRMDQKLLAKTMKAQSGLTRSSSSSGDLAGRAGEGLVGKRGAKPPGAPDYSDVDDDVEEWVAPLLGSRDWTSELECQLCQRALYYKESLAVHVQRVHLRSEALAACVLCPAAWPFYHSAARKHLSTAHQPLLNALKEASGDTLQPSALIRDLRPQLARDLELSWAKCFPNLPFDEKASARGKGKPITREMKRRYKTLGKEEDAKKPSNGLSDWFQKRRTGQATENPVNKKRLRKEDLGYPEQENGPKEAKMDEDAKDCVTLDDDDEEASTIRILTSSSMRKARRLRRAPLEELEIPSSDEDSKTAHPDPADLMPLTPKEIKAAKAKAKKDKLAGPKKEPVDGVKADPLGAVKEEGVEEEVEELLRGLCGRAETLALEQQEAEDVADFLHSLIDAAERRAAAEDALDDLLGALSRQLAAAVPQAPPGCLAQSLAPSQPDKEARCSEEAQAQASQAQASQAQASQGPLAAEAEAGGLELDAEEEALLRSLVGSGEEEGREAEEAGVLGGLASLVPYSPSPTASPVPDEAAAALPRPPSPTPPPATKWFGHTHAQIQHAVRELFNEAMDCFDVLDQQAAAEAEG